MVSFFHPPFVPQRLRSMELSLLDLTPKSTYIDRKVLNRSGLDEEDFVERRQKVLDTSCTVYVGNLSFYIAEREVTALFSQCGIVKRTTMILDSAALTPCGSAFVEFYSHADALKAVSVLNGVLLDDRSIGVSWDVGLDGGYLKGHRDTLGGDSALQDVYGRELRRWGRGFSGGLVVDGLRTTVDLARGGLGDRRAAAAGLTKTVLDTEADMYLWCTK